MLLRLILASVLLSGCAWLERGYDKSAEGDVVCETDCDGLTTRCSFQLKRIDTADESAREAKSPLP